MGVVEELADKLAVETLKAMDELGDDRFYMEMSKELGAASPTLQEAFMMSIRIRLAARRGHKFLDATLSARRKGAAPPKAPPDSSSAH
ncbi:MAG: hypothetical protein WBA91_04780 [Paracoccaceae bacterium]